MINVSWLGGFSEHRLCPHSPPWDLPPAHGLAWLRQQGKGSWDRDLGLFQVTCLVPRGSPVSRVGSEAGAA